MSPYEANMNGAAMARKLAAEYLVEAETASTERAFYLITQHDECIERAAWYEAHAALFAPKIELETAA